MLTIRPLQQDDSAHVLRLNQPAAPAVFRLDTGERARLLALSALHLAATEPDGRLRGYVLAFDSSHADDGEEFAVRRTLVTLRFVYIDQVATDPQRRGAGVGRSLYAALAQRARAQGAAVLCCEVNACPPNPDSLAFHQRLGFDRIADLWTRNGRVVAPLRRAA